jgi:hypothetical protein
MPCIGGVEVLPDVGVLAPPQAQSTVKQSLDQAVLREPGTKVGNAGCGEPAGQQLLYRYAG